MFRMLQKSPIKALAFNACIVLAAIQLAGCSSREQRAQNYYQHAMSYIEKKDFIKAQIELRNALQIKPDLLPAWRALEQVDEQAKNWRGVSVSLRKIIELDPKDIQAKIKLGRLFLLAGAIDEALKVANTAIDQEPQNTSVLALKAAVLYKLKDIDGAISTAEAALKIDPGNSEASVVLASTKFMQGDAQGALKVLENIKSDKQGDFGVMFLKVNIFNKLGELDQVEGLLQKFVTLYPKEPLFRAQLVRFYVSHNRPDDAIKELRTVVAQQPQDVTAELQLVNLLGALKGAAAARDELVARIDAGGNVFPYQIALAKVDFAQGNVDDSTKLLQKLISSTTAPDDVNTARITLAGLYLSKNNIPPAEPLIAEVLKSDSRNTVALMLRASIHMDRGQTDDAVADLRTALNDQPNSPELLLNLAVAYERNGSIELADKAFLDATKASNYSPVVGLNYVAFLRRRGLASQAETVLTDLASRNPNNVPVLSALAQAKLAHQDWAAAHKIADAIRNLDSKSALADQINGAAFSGEKKFNESLASLQNAYENNPGAIQPMAALVSVYMQAKQTERAEAFLQAALKANPSNAEALVLLGSVQMAKNDPAKAVENFEAAIKLKPKDVIGYRAMADFYRRQKKYDDAIKYLQAGLDQQPRNFELRLILASVQEIKGNYDAAISEYQGLLKDQPGSMIVANNLASLLADHRTDKASIDQAHSLTLLLTKSQIPQFKDTMGWVDYQRKNYPAAISQLEGARSELPNDAIVRYHLGMSYMASGQDEKASEQLKKARELAPNNAELLIKIDAALKGNADKTKG